MKTYNIIDIANFAPKSRNETAECGHALAWVCPQQREDEAQRLAQAALRTVVKLLALHPQILTDLKM